MSSVDDFSSDISTVGFISVGGSSTGEVEHPGDRDWFNIFLIGGLTYRFNLNGNTLFDTTLFLRDSSGAELAFNDDITFDGVVTSNNSEIVFAAVASDDYFLDAGAFSSGSTGSYTLSATNVTVDDFTDTAATTGTISVGSSSSGVVGTTGDRDWFRIDLIAGGTYRFNLNGNTLSDPTLFLRDASGAALAFNDDSGIGLNSEIVFTALTSGTYFLDAGPFSSFELGTYTLSATLTAFAIAGTNGNDSLVGGIGDDTFSASRGNDSYDGADGIDTVDYSSLGQRVTLKSQGVIVKDGGFGTDTIAGVERIIGTLGKANVIDGTVAGPQATSFNINLATNNLTVNGIPGIGSASFFVQNFTAVRGTSNADIVVGDGNRNGFFGTAGNDNYDGLGGFDTIDYSALGTAITLKSQGIIEKGALGTDTIAGMERIIGATGQINLIDGFTGGPQPTSFEIDLDGGLLLVKDIPFIGDQAFFIRNFVNVQGTSNDDFITGSSVPGIQGDNTFFGSSGNDSYDGAGGIDTIDYSNLGQRVTLKSQGVIEKGGAFGTDTIAGVERIIGTLGQFNVIDGTVAGPQTTSFDINLATNNLTVNGIPGIGSTSFFVQNFTDVRGTSNADIVVGDGARNVFFGTAGFDSYDGLGGLDTVDYSALGTAITLKSQGIIEKGALGTDTIAGMERIIGAAGQINVIDGFTGGPQPTSFEIDLDGGLLLVKDIPFIGDQAFFIRNFINVRGTSNDDVITGSSVPGTQGDNTFFGSNGNDSYDGAGGIDTIDYSDLGQQVTLKSQGVIEKFDFFNDTITTDTIAGVERIIGSLGQFNVIDGTVAGPQTTSFNINLATNNLTVNGIPGIGSTSFFIQNFTDVRGTSNSDTVFGDDSNSFFFGSAGNDSYDGGGGPDRIDYSGLGQSITLKSQGVIEKAGGLGTDTIAGIDQIIGDVGQSNLIDGTVAGPQVTSFNINLATNNLTVNGIPGIGSTSFFIQNFTNVRGTSNSDTVVGDGVLNSFFGSAGNDSYDGADDIDTIDYSTLGQRVTLKSQGVIEKAGGLGTDTIAGVERIIGTLGQANVIDGTVAGPQTTSFNINLATNNLTVNGIPGIGSASFFVQNFTNVLGTSNSDTVVGDALANSFTGGGGNDTLNTGAGNDTLIGSAGNDTLIGGAGNDSYSFDTDLALGTDTLNEAGGGVDTLNFGATTTRSVAVNLGLATSQVVNAGLSLTLGSATTFENVIGGNLADTLTGNTLANNLNGGGGNDTINGGGGNDTLTGGAGADRFRFATTLNATTNRDVISDFSIAQMDTIELENAVFTAFTTTGTLAAPAFFIGAAATNANQRILYNSATGGLFYDEDGSGAIGSIAFATLNSGLALNNTFFTIT